MSSVSGHAATPSVEAIQRRPPNLVVMTIDSLRADHVGPEAAVAAMPGLAAFAREAAVFSNAFSVSAWTFPGVATTMTGRYPAAHGLDARGREIVDVETLPEVLAAAGYRVPTLNYLQTAPGMGGLGLEPAWQRPPTGPGSEASLPTLVAWLSSEEARARPFLAWDHPRGLHLPYNPRPEVLAQFGAVGSSPGVEHVRQYVILPARLQSFLPEEHEQVAALYAATAREVDDYVGRVVTALRDNDLLDTTVVVITADHGEELFEHGLLGHASTTEYARLYDEVLRIPLVVRAPGEKLVAPDCQVSQIDIMPTALSLLGLAPPSGLDGVDLSAALRGAPCNERTIFAESIQGGFQAHGASARTFLWAVREADRKLIVTRDVTGLEAHELFDLANDPGERRNVAESQPEEAARLRRALDDFIARHGGPTYWQGPVEEEENFTGRPPGIASPPRVLRPVDDSDLTFDADGATVVAEWSGSPAAVYVIEYEVGEGAFRTTGTFENDGNRIVFGPMPLDVWNSLAQFNPWRARVYPRDHPDAKSDWVQFDVEPR